MRRISPRSASSGLSGTGEICVQMAQLTTLRAIVAAQQVNTIYQDNHVTAQMGLTIHHHATIIAPTTPSILHLATYVVIIVQMSPAPHRL